MGWMGPGHTSMAMCSWMLMVGFSPLRCVMHAVQPGAYSQNQKTRKKKKKKNINRPTPSSSSGSSSSCVFWKVWVLSWVGADGWTGPGDLWMSPLWSTWRSGGCCCVFQCCPQTQTMLSDSLIHTTTYPPALSSSLLLYPHTLPTSALPISEREQREWCVRECAREGRD